jgi:MFS family permease
VTRLRAASAETFRSLHLRNFRLFFSGQAISQIGNWLTLVAQTLLVLEITHSGVALGLLAAFQFGPVLLLGAYAGLVADRSDKRRLLMIVQAGAMLQSFTLAALAFTDHPPVGAVYAVALLGGFFTAFDNPARRSFVVEMVPGTEVNNAVALNTAMMTGSRVIGPAIAGFLVTTVGFGWCFLLDGVSYVAVLAGLWRMDATQLHPSPVAPRGKGQVRDGVRYARSVPELWIPLWMMALVGTLTYNFSTVMPLFATRDLHGTVVTYTILMSVISVGSVLGALHAARRQTITVLGVTRNAVLFGGSMALLSLAPNLPAALAVGFVVGVSSIAFMTSSTAIVQLRADPSMRGRVLALQSMVFMGSTPIGGPIVGAVAEAFGARYSVAIGGVACFLAASVGYRHLRRAAAEPLAVPEEARTVGAGGPEDLLPVLASAPGSPDPRLAQTPMRAWGATERAIRSRA